MRGKLAVWGSIATIVMVPLTLLPSGWELRQAAVPSARAEAPTPAGPIVVSEAATTSNVSVAGTGDNSPVNTTSGDGNISVGDIGAKENATTIINTGEGGVHISTTAQERRTPSYLEPTGVEMKSALLHEMQARGAVAKGPETVVFENPLAGMALDIVQFEKLGCAAAQSRPGYVCDYRYTYRVTAYSNEGSAAGDSHAQGVNLLMQLAMGGRDTQSGTTHRRFIKSGQGWVTSDT